MNIVKIDTFLTVGAYMCSQINECCENMTCKARELKFVLCENVRR